MKRFWILLALFIVAIAFPSFNSAQTLDHVPTGNEPDTVYAVFFYLPTCPHCHEVIDTVFPTWYDEFGDQLVIIPLNANDEGVETLFSAACRAYDVARCGSVPLLIIGEQYMLGSLDIPNIGTPLIRRLIDEGGSPLPDFYGMDEYFIGYQQAIEAQLGTEIVTDTGGNLLDDGANVLAIFILIVLVVSVAVVVVYGRRGQTPAPNLSRAAIILTLGLSIAVALTLVAAPEDNTLASLAAWSVLTLVGIVAMLQILTLVDRTFTQTALQWAVPLIAVAGLGVAMYLAHIETTATEAVCGTIGNCNAVQESEYASLLGIPIGVLGIIGYTGILAAWVAGRLLHQPYAEKLLVVMILFGAMFSIYLTFLEPFIIGATCAWCLMSALTMLMLLWLVLPQAGTTLNDFVRRPPPSQVA